MLPNLRRFIIASFTLGIILQPVVSAVGFSAPPPISNREKAHQNIIFTGGGAKSVPGECGEGGDSSVSLSGKDNAEKIFNYLRSKGLSRSEEHTSELQSH